MSRGARRRVGGAPPWENAVAKLDWEHALTAIRLMSETLLAGMQEPPAYAFLPGPKGIVGIPLGVTSKESWQDLLARSMQKPDAPEWFGFLLPSQTIRKKPGDKRMELLIMGCIHRDGRQQGAAYPYVSSNSRILVKGNPESSPFDFRALFGDPWLRAPEPGHWTTHEPAPPVPGELGRLWAGLLRGAKAARVVPGALLLAGNPPQADVLTRRRRSIWPQAIDRAIREDGATQFLLAFASDAYVSHDGGPAFLCDEPGQKFFAWVWRSQGQPSIYGVFPYTWSDLLDSDFASRRPTPEMRAYLDRLVPDPWGPAPPPSRPTAEGTPS